MKYAKEAGKECMKIVLLAILCLFLITGCALWQPETKPTDTGITQDSQSQNTEQSGTLGVGEDTSATSGQDSATAGFTKEDPTVDVTGDPIEETTEGALETPIASETAPPAEIPPEVPTETPTETPSQNSTDNPIDETEVVDPGDAGLPIAP